MSKTYKDAPSWVKRNNPTRSRTEVHKHHLIGKTYLIKKMIRDAYGRPLIGPVVRTYEEFNWDAFEDSGLSYNQARKNSTFWNKVQIEENSFLYVTEVHQYPKECEISLPRGRKITRDILCYKELAGADGYKTRGPDKESRRVENKKRRARVREALDKVIKESCGVEGFENLSNIEFLNSDYKKFHLWD